MTINEFHREFGRLEKHFRLEEDNRKQVTTDWFKALSHYHVDAFSTAVDEVIEQATDTFWPALGKITTAIRSRMSRHERTRQQCATCHGTMWIDVMPEFDGEGRLYERMARCPDCGVPAPSYTPNRSAMRPLTATEYAQYIAGELPQLRIECVKPSSVVKQALDAIRKTATMKPIQQVDMTTAVREPGEEG